MPIISQRLQSFEVLRPVKGLQTEDPPHFQNPDQSSKLKNLRFEGGVITKIPGYAKLGNNIAADLDGTDDSFSLADGSQTGLDIVGDITIEALIQPTDLSGAQMIVAKWGNATANQSYRFYTDGNTLKFEISDGTSKESHVGGPLVVGTLYKVKGTWNVTTRKLVTHIDDVEQSTPITTTLTAIANGAADIRLGADNSGAADAVANFYGGGLGYVRISDDSLEDGEVEPVAFTRRSSTQALWRVTIDSSSTYQDDSDNGNHLTVNGSFDLSASTVSFGQLYPPVLGDPLKLLDWEDQSHRLLVTSLKVYDWNSSFKYWKDITDGNLSGGLSTSVDMGIHASSKTVLIANTGDVPKKFATGDSFISNVSGLTAGYKAKIVKTLANRGLLINVIDDGSGGSFPVRIQWSTFGDIAAWDETNDNADVSNTTAPIETAEYLGSDLILYSKQEIIKLWATGSVFPVHAAQVVNARQGIVAPRTLASIQGVGHIFLGEDNVYLFTGAPQLIPLADALRPSIFDEIDPNGIVNATASYIPLLREYQLFFPESGDKPTIGYSFNLTKKVWSGPIELPNRTTDQLTMVSNIFIPNPISIGDLVGSIGDQDWLLGDTFAEATTPEPMFATTGGSVFKFTRDTESFDGASIDAEFQSGEFRFPDARGRWQELEIDVRGINTPGTLFIEFSLDGGIEWEGLQAIELHTTGFQRKVLYFDFESEGIMFRVLHNETAGNFELIRFVMRGMASVRA